MADPSGIALTFVMPIFRDACASTASSPLSMPSRSLPIRTIPDIQELKLRQIDFSDLVVLNKIDLVSEDERQAVRDWIESRFNRVRASLKPDNAMCRWRSCWASVALMRGSWTMGDPSRTRTRTRTRSIAAMIMISTITVTPSSPGAMRATSRCRWLPCGRLPRSCRDHLSLQGRGLRCRSPRAPGHSASGGSSRGCDA